MDADAEAYLREAGAALGLLRVIAHRQQEGATIEAVVVGSAEALIASMPGAKHELVFVMRARTFQHTYTYYGPRCSERSSEISEFGLLGALGLRSQEAMWWGERLAEAFNLPEASVVPAGGRRNALLTLPLREVYPGGAPIGFAPWPPSAPMESLDTILARAERERVAREEYEDGGTI